MAEQETLGEQLRRQGISRRSFLKFCAATASLMALPPGMAGAVAAALPLRLAGNADRGATLWPRWARLALGAGLGTLVGAIAYLNFQVLALQYTDPRLSVVLLGGAGLALGAAVAATFRWPLVWRLVGAAFTKHRNIFAERGAELWKPFVRLDRPREAVAQLIEKR